MSLVLNLTSRMDSNHVSLSMHPFYKGLAEISAPPIWMAKLVHRGGLNKKYRFNPFLFKRIKHNLCVLIGSIVEG